MRLTIFILLLPICVFSQQKHQIGDISGESLGLSEVNYFSDPSTSVFDAHRTVSFVSIGLREGTGVSNADTINVIEAYNSALLKPYLDSFSVWGLNYIVASDGRWYFDSTLIIRDFVKIIGSRYGPTGSSSELLFLHSDCGIHALPNSSVYLEGFYVSMRYIPDPTYGVEGQDSLRDQSGIHCEGWYHLKNVFIQFPPDHGLNLNNTSSSFGGVLENCSVRRAQKSCIYKPSTDTTFHYWKQPDVNLALADTIQSYGIYDNSPMGGLVVAPHASTNKTADYWVSSADSTNGINYSLYSNPYAEGQQVRSFFDFTVEILMGLIAVPFSGGNRYID